MMSLAVRLHPLTLVIVVDLESVLLEALLFVSNYLDATLLIHDQFFLLVFGELDCAPRIDRVDARVRLCIRVA
jgi:hypothetical protein